MTTPINWQSWHVKKTPYYEGFSRRLEQYAEAYSLVASQTISAEDRSAYQKRLMEAFEDLYAFASQAPQPELNEHGDPLPGSELAPYGTASVIDKLSPYEEASARTSALVHEQHAGLDAYYTAQDEPIPTPSQNQDPTN